MNAASLVVSPGLTRRETARVNAVKEATCCSGGNVHNRVLQEAELQRLQ